VIRYIVRRHERFVFNRLAIIPVFAVLFLAARDGGQFVALSIAAFDDPVFFHGRFHASVAPLDSRFKIPDATMEELSFRTRTDRAPCTNILELPDYVCPRDAFRLATSRDSRFAIRVRLCDFNSVELDYARISCAARFGIPAKSAKNAPSSSSASYSRITNHELN